MRDLTIPTNEIEDNQLIKNEQHEALIRLSKERLREFFHLMKSHNIPSENFVFEEVAEGFSIFGVKTRFRDRQGWVIKDTTWISHDILSGTYLDGIVVFEDMTLGKWHRSYDYITMYVDYALSTDKYLDTYPGTDEGLETLNNRLAEYGITR